MSTTMFLSAVVVFMCVGRLTAQEEDDIKVCNVFGKGKLTTYAVPDKALNIKFPCKYQFSWVKCGKDVVKLYPGQDFDLRSRYFTNTLLVTVEREDDQGTTHTWQGRTETKRSLMFLAGKPGVTAFNVLEDDVEFTMKESIEPLDNTTVALKSTSSSWTIKFTVNYDQKNRDSLNDAGIAFSCPNAEFVEESAYPMSICGNNTDLRAVKKRRKLTKVKNVNNQVMYDIMMNLQVSQTNKHCKAAVATMQKCSKADRTTAIDKCAPIMRVGKVVKCISGFAQDPMEAFQYCLDYHCGFGGRTSCMNYMILMYGCSGAVDDVPNSC